MLREHEGSVLHERRRGERRRGWTSFSVAPQREIDVTVILPAYNEELALPNVLEGLVAVLGENSEIIVVDDCSTDTTADIARGFPCRLLQHEVNQGKGAAVRTGLRAAQGRFVIIMDADNTYPAQAIPRMVELSEEHDFVRCVRSEGHAHMPLVNRLGNKVFDGVLKTIYGLEGTDHLSGLYGLTRAALDRINFESDGFDMEVEIGIKARAHRLRCITFPIDYQERLGEKKLRAYKDGWSILHRVLSMIILYKPGLAFVTPGLVIWSMTAVMMVALTFHQLRVGMVTLSLHALMGASLGVTVGFQLVVFGIAAALYGVERGAAPSTWLKQLGRRGVRLGLMIVGGMFTGVGLSLLGLDLIGWTQTGGTQFRSTDMVVLGGALVTWGVESVLASLFISIFARQLMPDLTLKGAQLRAITGRKPVPARDAALVSVAQLESKSVDAQIASMSN